MKNFRRMKRDAGDSAGNASSGIYVRKATQMASFKENDLLIYFAEDPRTPMNFNYLYDLILYNGYSRRFWINYANNSIFVNFDKTFNLYTDIFRELK